MSPVLVIGSNSFAGSSFIDHLLSIEKSVIGISRSNEPNPILLSYSNNPNKKLFSFYKIDINHQLGELEKLIQKLKPSVIVDFAGQGMVAESWESPEQWYTTNIVSKVKLHDFLRTCDFIERYIRISTPEVYGNVDGPMMENQAYNPSTPYAVSHAAIDMSLLAFHKQYQFPASIARFANFYGPHQQLYRIIPRTIIYSLIQKKLLLHGGGLSTRSFIYHTDVANALCKVIDKGSAGEIYHFSGTEYLSIASLVKKICALLNVNYDLLVEKTNDRPGKDMQYLLDDAQSKKKLNWQSEMSLEMGLKNTINWVKNNINEIKKLPLDYLHKP